MSLRGAARTIGRTHPTLIRRMRRDRQFAEKMREARRQARLEPLKQIQEASRRSWRAAAWLVKYIDARESGVRPAGSLRGGLFESRREPTTQEPPANDAQAVVSAE
jgi:hypothetical protein